MRRWTPQGIAAVVLAVCVAGSYAAVLIITALQGGPVTPEGAALLDTLGGLLAGALAGWLGGAAYERRTNKHDVDEDDAS